MKISLLYHLAYLLPFFGTLAGWLTGGLMTLILRNSARVRRQGRRLFRENATALVQKVVTAGNFAASLRNPALLDELKPSIEAHVDVFLQEKLKEKVPVLSVFIGGSTLDKIKAGLLEEIDLLLPEVIGQYADRLGGRLDTAALADDKIRSLPDGELDALLRPVWKPVGLCLQLTGALTGLLVAALCFVLVVIL